jgi:alpha-mannosidase
VVWRFGRSRAVQRWRLPLGACALTLVVDVDWREDDRVLKLAWPLASSASHLSVGVQHGTATRRVRAETPWEHARYEDWFHGFLHLDDGARRLALVTADVHGYDTVTSTDDAVVRLTLLRAPRFPDPDCDRGPHTFTVDLRVGDDVESVTRAARRARRALVPRGATGGLAPVVEVADDGSGDVVVRFHEALGQSTTVHLRSRAPLAAVAATDLLERPLSPPEAVGGHGLVQRLGPFELRTVRLRRAERLPAAP